MLPVTWHDHDMQSLCGIFLFLVLAAAAPANAQTTPPRRTAWDGVYTEAQATRGATAFGQSCSGCHSLAGQGKSVLSGDPFWKSFSQKTVGDLLDYVSANMPNGAPGTLTESTYRDIVAVMLKSNDFPAGTAELERNTVAGVQIIPKDGRRELPADALAHVVGCLARKGADWVVTNATNPERAERSAPPSEDATKPLGSRTLPLKFVITKLDSLAGSRVAVNGLLIGPGGVDGINVTAVNRVADKCP